MAKKGFYWHVHHDILLEWCYDYDERVKFIKENKSKNEIKSRLRLFKKVKGKFPVKVIKTWEAYIKAEKASIKAGKAYDKAWKTYNKAIQKHMPAIEKLHQKECPNCPWDDFFKQIIFRDDPQQSPIDK